MFYIRHWINPTQRKQKSLNPRISLSNYFSRDLSHKSVVQTSVSIFSSSAKGYRFLWRPFLDVCATRAKKKCRPNCAKKNRLFSLASPTNRETVTYWNVDPNLHDMRGRGKTGPYEIHHLRITSDYSVIVSHSSPSSCWFIKVWRIMSQWLH